MSTAHVLIIEDDLDNLEMVQFLLQRAGYATLTAQNGTEGLQLAQNQLPELILLDMTIPGLDGWKLAAALKADESTRRIPIIALTAHTLPGDRKRALDAGCDGYISKPLNVETFLEDVAAFLSRKAE